MQFLLSLPLLISSEQAIRGVINLVSIKSLVLQLPSLLTIASGYPQEYRAMQLHFHWGSQRGPGSEHTVDGRRYDGEIHMVFYNPAYDSIKEAMKKPDGLAVLAAFLQVRAGPLRSLEHLQYFLLPDKKTTVAGFNIAGLLPANLDHYYRYSGSLTTPPCYQTVNWTVFNHTVRLSQTQVLLETTLQGDDHETLENNFRLPQPLHGRQVLASFQAAGGRRPFPFPGKEQGLGLGCPRPPATVQSQAWCWAGGDTRPERLCPGKNVSVGSWAMECLGRNRPHLSPDLPGPRRQVALRAPRCPGLTAGISTGPKGKC
uniref:Carbonic anhydrase n=1 Tax=Pelusios castaneus TaxID=367368 RepID=A0A8C8S835_9SAUR